MRTSVTVTPELEETEVERMTETVADADADEETVLVTSPMIWKYPE